MSTTGALVLTAVLLAQVGVAGGDKRFRQLFNHYNAIRLALASDTMLEVPYHADRLGVLARGLAQEARSSGKVESRVTSERLRAISDAAREVAFAAGIEKARAAFARLSRALLAYRGAADLEGLVVVFCPLHNNVWLQRFKDEVSNPYMGASRARCGEVLELRTPRWVPSRPSGRSPAEPPERSSARPQGG